MPEYLVHFIYLVLSCNQVLSQLDTDLDVRNKNKTDLSLLNWDLWCKFQPNENECSNGGISVGRFYYDLKMEDCKTFNYGYCPNSYNNFATLKDCYDTCRDDGLHVIKRDLTPNVYCRLQPEFGNCYEYHPMFYFDINKRQCVGFSYSGCGGNVNRFATAQICNIICTPEFEF